MKKFYYYVLFCLNVLLLTGCDKKTTEITQYILIKGGIFLVFILFFAFIFACICAGIRLIRGWLDF